MLKLFESAARVSNQWSLAAFAMAAILYLVLRRRGKIPPIAWAAIVAILMLAALPIIGSVYVQTHGPADPIYRVRVAVLDPQQVPLDDAKVWSSMGGEPKKVAGGWQFDIPTATKPADGKLVIHAAIPSAFLTARRELQLGEDRNPSIIIQLARDTSAIVRGIVTDAAGRAIAGARVSVIGYESEAFLTQSGGNFVLPAHAASGQQVQLHTERAGYQPISQWHPAGEEPVTLVLDRR